MAGADWRSIIADRVAVAAADTRANSTGTSADQRFTRVAFSLAAHPYLLRAARARGISLSGYTRRATLARVADDLGMDPQQLFLLDNAIAPFGKGGNGGHHREFDLDGTLYGRWEVGYGNAAGDRE